STPAAPRRPTPGPRGTRRRRRAAGAPRAARAWIRVFYGSPRNIHCRRARSLSLINVSVCKLEFRMTRTLHAQVLVVGAGPVGLTLAMDLAQRGIDVLVAETRFRGEPPNVKCNHVS